MIEVGHIFEARKRFTRGNVQEFASLSGDDNPLHLDDYAAQQQGFDRSIVHGMLMAAWLSQVLGKVHPGPGTVYLHQSLDFKSPLYVEAEAILRLETLAVRPDKGIVEFKSEILEASSGKLLVTGRAVVKNKEVFR